jgi:RNA polymerase sigma factor (sigma-70 family)
MLDHHAIISLIAENRDFYYRVCRHYLRYYSLDRNDHHKDLFQEMVVALYQYDPTRLVKTWNDGKMYMLVCRILANMCSKQGYLGRKLCPHWEINVPDFGQYDLSAWDPEFDIEEEIDRSEALDLAMAKLPAYQRNLFLLYLDCGSIARLAKLTGLSDTSLGLKIRKIRDKLKQKTLEKCMEGAAHAARRSLKNAKPVSNNPKKKTV